MYEERGGFTRSLILRREETHTERAREREAEKEAGLWNFDFFFPLLCFLSCFRSSCLKKTTCDAWLLYTTLSFFLISYEPILMVRKASLTLFSRSEGSEKEANSILLSHTQTHFGARDDRRKATLLGRARGVVCSVLCVFLVQRGEKASALPGQ